MKLCCLLGSGISIPATTPAGLLSVENLTKAVLCGDGFIMHPDGRVEPIVNGLADYVVEEGRKKVRRILIFLDWLKLQANSSHAEIPERRVNYEDLAYLAGQISDDLVSNYENPALQPFVRNALIDLGALFPSASPGSAREELQTLASSAVDYLRQIVALLLSKAPTETSHLQIFADACQDPLVSEVNLFTLNHDTFLERFLKEKGNETGFKVVDGLRDAGDGSHRWDASVFDASESERRVNLFKLHGSVDWFRWGPRHGSLQNNVVRANADRDVRFIGTYQAQDPKKPLYEHVLESEGPRILAGTFNKILDYNTEIFIELHHWFHCSLQDCTTLVVCGYGFGDKGVNTRIAEWRHKPSIPKLVIIDPAEPSKIVQKARGAIQREIAALDPQTAIGPLSPGPVLHWQNGLEERLKSSGDPIITWERIRAVLQDC